MLPRMAGPYDALRSKLAEIEVMKQASEARRAEWNEVSKSVHTYLTEVAKALEDHPVVSEAKLYATRDDGESEPLVTLRFGNVRTPLRRKRDERLLLSIQHGAVLAFSLALSGHVRVLVDPPYIKLDRDIVGGSPQTQVLAVCLPGELNERGLVHQYLEQFLTIVAETDWSTRKDVNT